MVSGLTQGAISKNGFGLDVKLFSYKQIEIIFKTILSMIQMVLLTLT